MNDYDLKMLASFRLKRTSHEVKSSKVLFLQLLLELTHFQKISRDKLLDCPEKEPIRFKLVKMID